MNLCDAAVANPQDYFRNSGNKVASLEEIIVMRDML